MPTPSLYTLNDDNGDITVHDSTAVATAGGYLWNHRLLLNMTCQGYANVHFMQPEPASYSCGPALEAKTFLQPEHQYYPGHPGRFFYFHDKQADYRFSAPYAPVNARHDRFAFDIKKHQLSWTIEHKHWRIELCVHLPQHEVAEFWSLSITNTDNQLRTLQHCSCFNIGNQSWMNQSATYEPTLGALVANKVTPYQKTADYAKQQHYLEQTYLLSEQVPDSWTASLRDFLGEGDWQQPQSLLYEELDREPAIYETPLAALQFSRDYLPGERQCFRFVFGPAKDHSSIRRIRDDHLSAAGFAASLEAALQRARQWQPKIHLQSPDDKLNHFVNHWLCRQVIYHGETQRLTTDPQTRNYLQDAMGMCFIDPAIMRTALLTTLAQQHSNGEVPDGILLHPDAELKYINQIPHSDHAAWLPICLAVYIDETADTELMFASIGYADSTVKAPLWLHIDKAMDYLRNNLDERNLSLIAEGDWCDPMNMVGHQGKGVSAWLSMATAWSFQLWGALCQRINKPKKADYWLQQARRLNQSINDYFWQDSWYARGITDAGRTFGTPKDEEGQIFLNPQSWALLCGAADSDKLPHIIHAVQQHLMTAHGPQMLAPPYTRMHQDIGRLTQKFPGVAENGSVYCHAAAFYLYALWQQGKTDEAFAVLDSLITDPSNCRQRGQLPVYIPNYFRGAPQLYPQHLGRSSRLFNTGTVAWVLRAIVEELCGLKGCEEGLHIQPKLPSHWPSLTATRTFRGHRFDLRVTRNTALSAPKIQVNGQRLKTSVLSLEGLATHCVLDVQLPAPQKE
ncbi:GH36-type glycosyl hydrolase domain-containing protein [Alteromonas sp. 14N.309.X.WAT.G.H12]|uniref:GH36-type glycosyl hydrolase domain-containing protein n=1 Tax=Alteromonas sp. 14N.309.X.WAT.G.H12 TaxID=3120824 RepID=UPI002FD4B919